MVVGKLLILLSISIPFATVVQAGEIDNPTFYTYSGGPFMNRLMNMSFGFFRKLDNQQLEAYNQAVTHAVNFAEAGERVQWYHGDASGYAVPVHTWPTHGGGYCRRIHIQVIAYNQEKVITETACFNGANSTWRWAR